MAALRNTLNTSRFSRTQHCLHDLVLFHGLDRREVLDFNDPSMLAEFMIIVRYGEIFGV